MILFRAVWRRRDSVGASGTGRQENMELLSLSRNMEGKNTSSLSRVILSFCWVATRAAVIQLGQCSAGIFHSASMSWILLSRMQLKSDGWECPSRLFSALLVHHHQ